MGQVVVMGRVYLWLLLGGFTAACGAKTGLMIPEQDDGGRDAGPRTIDPCLEGRRPRRTLSAGSGHACATGADGLLYCWGANPSGTLGRGTFDDTTAPLVPHPVPARVVGLESVSWHAADIDHTCAVTTSDRVECWGLLLGSLHAGVPTFTVSAVPLAVPAPADLAEVEAGLFTTCIRTCTGNVYCMGNNLQGQIGDGTTEDRGDLQAVPALMPVARVEVGEGYSCALHRDATISCWGTPPPTNETLLQPTLIPHFRATALSAGSGQVCAAQDDGSIWCWGYNDLGQLGDGTTMHRRDPAQVVGLTDVVNIAVGQGGYDPYTVSGATIHTCALHSTGRVSCWGVNVSGQLGGGTRTEVETSPVEVSGLTDAVEIVAGDSFTCARRRGGAVVCWGANDMGQLGDGTTTDRNVPTPVLLPR